MGFAGLWLFGLSLPAFAQAPPQPVLFGQRDFEMEWQMEPGNKLLRFRFHASTRRLRIDALDGSGQTMLRDLAKGTVVVLVANGAKGTYAGSVKPMGPFQPQQVGELQMIAGEPCRDFVLDGQTLCLTADGIPVMLDFGSGKATAQRLIRETQPVAFFDLPPGLTPKPLPGNGPGSIPKGLF